MSIESALNEWVAYRLALLTLAATLVLMVLGGLVTNTGPGIGFRLPVTHRAGASLILGLVVMLTIRAHRAPTRTQAETIATPRPATEMVR